MTLPLNVAPTPAAASPAAGAATRLEFVVVGQPAAQGSKRPVGGGRLVEQSKNVKPWRDAVRTDAAQARGVRPPLLGPLAVTLIFTVRKPASAPKRRRTWPATRPDVDKLVRSTFDALTDAGAWADDGQVVELLAIKRYTGDPGALPTPGARIAISPIEEP